MSMANRSDFDWSLLDRDGVAGFIWMLSPKIVNQRLTVDQFHGMIYRHLKKYMPLRVSKTKYNKAYTNTVMIGGCYYSELDQYDKLCIEVSLLYNPKDEYLKFNTRKFYRVCVVIADTILHEIIHMRQFRRRAFKDLPDYPSTARRASKREEQSYLGNSDEIDAYGFNIACDLIDRYKNIKNVVRHLNIDQKNKRVRYDEWFMYLKAFDHDHNHPIIKKVKKKVLQYLPNAAIGKPYRNKDWICY
jgi:hypothetical protein